MLVTVSFEVEPLDPLALFAAFDNDASTCVYWQSGTPSLSLFGLGCALELAVSGNNSRVLDVDRAWNAILDSAVQVGPQGPRLVGGFRFDRRTEPQPHWREFPAASMVLSETLVVRDARHCWIVCQRMLRETDDPGSMALQAQAQVDAMLKSQASSADTAPRATRVETMALPPPEWHDKVRRAVEAIRRGEMDKVVMARELVHRHAQPIDVPALLERLRRQNLGAHMFAVRKRQACFLGASPERLVRVQAGQVTTHALAGTAPRGSDAHSDCELGRALMASAKERQEHAVVVDSILSALAPLTCALDLPEHPELRLLPRLQHLSTPIHAKCLPQVGPLQLIDALHPTPAVAGHGRDAAMDFIRHHEGFDRGWYAAPLGWVDAQGNGDFLVALRSALVTGSECRMFAGCGIVADSQPEHEYQETCLKLSGMLAALEPEGN